MEILGAQRIQRVPEILGPQILALRGTDALEMHVDHLLRMQLAYDVARTRQHAREIAVERYTPA